MTADGTDVEWMMRRAIGGDATAAAWVKERAAGERNPVLLALASILAGRAELLAGAIDAARTTRDRQIVAITDAHLRGDRERVDALAREHLVDHPDSVLVAWIAAGADRDGRS